MSNNELDRIADLIWVTLNCKENAELSREQQTELIKPIISGCASDERQIGRNQILNYLGDEITNLRNKN